MPKSLRLGALGLAVVLVASCSTDNKPKNYNSDVQANYAKACLEANQQRPGIVDPAAFCGCTYRGFIETVKFDKFKEYDDAVRDKEVTKRSQLDASFPEIAKLIDSCTTAGPAPASDATTSTTTR